MPAPTPVAHASAHRLGQSWLDEWTPERVAHAPDPAYAFALYAQQVLGIPYPTKRDIILMRKRINDVFANEPRATYYSLCRVVTWCRRKKIRTARVYQIIDLFRDAWVDEILPELDEEIRDADINARIAEALEIETDVSWRRRLVGCSGTHARARALSDWTTARV